MNARKPCYKGISILGFEFIKLRAIYDAGYDLEQIFGNYKLPYIECHKMKHYHEHTSRMS